MCDNKDTIKETCGQICSYKQSVQFAAPGWISEDALRQEAEGSRSQTRACLRQGPTAGNRLWRCYACTAGIPGRSAYCWWPVRLGSFPLRMTAWSLPDTIPPAPPCSCRTACSNAPRTLCSGCRDPFLSTTDSFFPNSSEGESSYSCIHCYLMTTIPCACNLRTGHRLPSVQAPQRRTRSRVSSPAARVTEAQTTHRSFRLRSERHKGPFHMGSQVLPMEAKSQFLSLKKALKYG